MAGQPVTRANLVGIIMVFTVTLTALTKQMPNLENQVNNTNNNVETIVIKIRVLKKKNHTKKMLIVIDVCRCFNVTSVPENKQVKMVAIRMKVLLLSGGITLLFRGRGKEKGQSDLGEE
ncbi:unnamed protein product [Vicia faba]|uniref:Transmembrane protein n=1 Tax=Vicia faba TaxID=3906 RepID=A0AAV0YHQ0_VICFA|nr:unnamed protein product [Vicia faba]